MAISFDAAVDGGINFSGTSQSWSHTCGVGSATDGVLFVYGYGDSASNPSTSLTGVTYGGASMTQFGSPVALPSDRWFYLFYLLGPAAGSHSVVMSASTAIVLAGQSISYLDVAQTGFPDASNTASSDTATTISAAVTTVAANCWVLIFGKDTTYTPTITTGTQRLSGSSNNLAGGDSNGALSAGTPETLVMSTGSPAPPSAVYSISIAPYGGSPPPPTSTLGLIMSLL